MKCCKKLISEKIKGGGGGGGGGGEELDKSPIFGLTIGLRGWL